MAEVIQQQDKIQKQITLPLAKAVEISVKSLRIRLGRSVITTTTIIFAIAFLMAILTSSAINSVILKYGPEDVKVTLQNSLDEIRIKQVWLVLLSLIICIIGIINSMLMVVTERYKEIGTMKCLGALNKFIVELFVLESAFQGLLGSVVGIIIGISSMTILNVISNGSYIIKYFPVNLVLVYAFVSIFVGVTLSIVGVIYPAYVASKMVPADALRTEI